MPYRAFPTIGDLVVRPREASRYCDGISESLVSSAGDEHYDLPDVVIIRTIINIPKHGKGTRRPETA
jgi:hypothetical protein